MEITLPFKFKPRKYQIPLLKAFDSGITRGVCVWHRRAGKDKTALNLMIKKMYERVGTYFYILPTYSQGKKVIWDGMDKNGFRFLDHFPKELVTDRNETEMRIKLSNGSIFQVIGSENIDRIVGTNPIGVVFSEYSIQKPEVWDFIRPILAENGGWALFIYTARGMNHGWKLLQQAKDNAKWFCEVLTVDDTDVLSPEVLEEEKKQMLPDLFEQEYYCKFIEGAGAFFRKIDQVIWHGDLQPDKSRTYQMGVDLAKFEDFTVLTAIDMHDWRVGKQEAFNQIDYNLQKASIEAFNRRYNSGTMWIDSTGVGEPVFDDLSQRGVSVMPFKFNVRTRMDLLNNLRLLIEQGKLTLPDDPILLDQLRSFQYTLTDVGRIKVSVPEGIHDDHVMSLALACWDLGSPIANTQKSGLSRLLVSGEHGNVNVAVQSFE